MKINLHPPQRSIKRNSCVAFIRFWFFSPFFYIFSIFFLLVSVVAPKSDWSQNEISTCFYERKCKWNVPENWRRNEPKEHVVHTNVRRMVNEDKEKFTVPSRLEWEWERMWLEVFFFLSSNMPMTIWLEKSENFSFFVWGFKRKYSFSHGHTHHHEIREVSGLRFKGSTWKLNFQN